MANKWDFWLAEQRKLIDGGAAVSRVILEGADQTVWGTWPIGATDIDQSLEGILNSLREQLPRGKHAFKLIAQAPDGGQLAVYPLTIVGSNPDASDPGQSAINQQKATAMMISNFETSFQVLGKQLEHVANLAVKASEGNVALFERLEQIQTRMSTTMGEQLRVERRDARLDTMIDKFGPLLEVGVEFVATFASQWLANKQDSSGNAQPAGQLKAPEVQSPHAVQPEPAPPAASQQPAGSCPAGSDPRTEEPGSDVQGCASADSKGHRQGGGDPPARRPKRSEPKRTTR